MNAGAALVPGRPVVPRCPAPPSPLVGLSSDAHACDGRRRGRCAWGLRDRSDPGERGSGTVLMLGVLGAAVVLLTVVALLVGVLRARAVAQTAADLAAIAAATVLHDPAGGGDPCAVAEQAASAGSAALTACTIADGFVTTAVSVEGTFGTARATARAGPA